MSVKYLNRVANHRTNTVNRCQGRFVGFLEINSLYFEIIFEPEIMVFNQARQLLSETLRVKRLSQSDAPSRHFIFIGRTDTTPGCANFFIAALGFTRLIKLDMKWQDQWASSGNP